jgi:DMSO/TMAO reductase YedYZ molybdopterin-dependent catalytic subunit
VSIHRWRSPLRGPWLTSVFGSVLLVTLPIVILTGLLSYGAYAPRFGQALPSDVGWLKLPRLTGRHTRCGCIGSARASTSGWAWC